jgi:hypothetical protein
MPTPFFGIGAMRAGTSWLSDVLRSYPDCRISPMKELHFFDSRYGVASGSRMIRDRVNRLALQGTKVRDEVETALQRIARRTGSECDDDSEEDGLLDDNELRANSAHVMWTDQLRNNVFGSAGVDRRLKRIAELLEFFSIRDIDSYVAFLRRDSDDASAFGEITPSYALLPASAFAEMDRALPDARFVFIMRDPVDRLWSHVRYVASRRKKGGGKEPADLSRAFRRAMKHPQFVARSSYHHTIAALESVVHQRRILYLFHEKLVSPDTGPDEVRRIEAALGLRPRVPDPKLFQTTRNAAPEAELDAENQQAALSLFEAEYKFVADRFGRQPEWQWPKT